MKSLYKNYTFKLASAMLIAAVGLSACSKESKENGLSGGDRTKLSVSVVGITESEELAAPNLQMSASKTSLTNGQEDAPLDIKTFDPFDAAVSVERGTLDNKQVSVGSSSQGQVAGGLMAAAMEPGVKYRLLLFKPDGSLESSSVLTSGDVEEISITTDIEYDWYAISYNSDTEIPDVNPVTGSLDVPKNSDLLLASGTVLVADEEMGTNKPLGIVFSHGVARIGVELNTRGMFGDITAAELEVTGAAVATGTLNIFTGVWSNPTAYSPILNFEDLESVEGNDRMVGYIYTTDESSAVQNLTVVLSDLVISLEDNSTRSFTTQLTNKPVPFTFDITPVIGSTYTARIRLLESGIPINGVTWARTNLMSPAAGQYYFQPTNTHTNSPNTYFSFQGSRPMLYSRNSDPCLAVYPAGTWRQASRNDFRSLPNSATYGTEGGRGYFEYDGPAAPDNSYPSNDLRFNMNGYGLSVGLVGDALITVDLDLQDYGTNAQYWSSTQGSILGIISLGGYWYGGTRTGFGSPDVDLELAVELLGLDVLQTTFKNVRCVRN